MRRILAAVFVSLLLFCPGVASSTAQAVRFESQDARQLLATVRAAINSAGPVRSLRLQGTSVITPTIGTPLTYSTSILLRQPDGYLRVLTSDIVRQHRGFIGQELLSRNRQSDEPEAAWHRERCDGARLFVALTGERFEATATTVSRPSDTPTPLLRFQLDDDRCSFDIGMGVDMRPAWLRYRTRTIMPAAETNPRVVGPQSIPPAEDVMMTVRLEGRRLVQGLSVPFKLVREANGIQLEVIDLESVLVNPNLERSHFQKGRS